VLFEPAAAAPAWPTPPDPARIRYLGELRTNADLKPARGAFQGLGEVIFGADAPVGMISPIGVAIDDRQRLFIADSNAQLVHMMDLNTRAYAQWRPTSKAHPELRFMMPVAVACEPGGRILVSDSVNAEIFAFDAAGALVGRLGEGILRRPCGLAIHPQNGRIYVADSEAHQIVVLMPDGREVGRIGTRGSALGQLNFPTNVAFDANGRLYISDTLNFRIQVFSPMLEPLQAIGSKGDMPGSFSQPKGIALTPQGHLLVVDANFEAIQVFNAEGALLMSFGREGHQAGEFWLPSGIAADTSGRIFVADSYNQRVQVFELIPDGAVP
jgi:DNA-binding beta-propeller fold protein YncE